MKLSIALCTYNGERHIADQLDSYMKQTRPPDEVVICDDCSTDSTLSLVKAFAKTATFPVRVYVNESNLGCRVNFEKAAALCEGDVILLSDQDDFWYPHKLKRVEETLGSVPQAGALFSDADLVDEKLNPLGRTLWQAKRFGRSLQTMVMQGRSTEAVLKANDSWFGMSIAFRSEYRKFLMPFPPKIAHDKWIILLIAFAAEVTLIPEPLIQYRQHDANLTGIRVQPVYERMASAIMKERNRPRQRTYAGKTKPYEALRNRLAQLKTLPDINLKLNLLDQKIRHLQRRANMPRRRLYRIPYVINECFHRGYSRFSEGLIDVARDLLERD